MLKHFKRQHIQDLIATRGPLVRKQPISPRASQASSEFATLRPLRPTAKGDNIDSHEYGRARMRSLIGGIFGWLLLVVLPIFCGSLYFGLIASDRYVSQTEFIVRNVDGTGNGRLASMVSAQAGSAAASGISGDDSDAQVVVSFIESYDGMRAVDRSLNLRSLFSRPKADFLVAYPGPFRADSEYRLQQYFSGMANVDYEPTTGVIKLTTRAFRPEDAKAMAEIMLTRAEALVNRMDRRARQDAIRTASDQVAATYKEVLQAQANLTAFRLREKLVDPIKVSEAVIKTISDLANQSAALKTQLSDLSKNAPGSGQVGILRGQIASVEEQIAIERRKLTGPNGSMTPAVAEYQLLSLQRDFANRIYTSALEEAETARLQATRQHVFLERISGPTLADFAAQPRRPFMIALVIIAAFALFGAVRWGVGKLQV